MTNGAGIIYINTRNLIRTFKMIISKIMMIVLAAFLVTGLADRLLGNKYGYGAELERGFGLMGTIGLTVVGFICLAPVIAKGLLKLIGPLFSLIGADPAMFSGILFAPDINTPIVMEMTANRSYALLSGLIVSSVMGNTVSFIIPAATGIISKEDRRYLAIGTLCGFVLDPVACFAGGLMMGLKPLELLINLLPVMFIAMLIVIGLIRIPDTVIKLFGVFAKILMAVVSIGLGAAAVESMTGFVVIPGMNPISDAFKTVGTVTLSLGGSLPLLLALRKALKKPISALGKLLGLDDTVVPDMIIAFSSVIPGFADYGKMNPKSKVAFSTFTASASNAFGVCLGITSAFAAELVMPMIATKLLAGCLAILSVKFFLPRLFTGEEMEASKRN